MKLAIVGNRGKPQLADAVTMFLEQLMKHGMEFVVEEEVAGLLSLKLSPDHVGSKDDCHKQGDILVAFGGDGTILYASRDVGARGIPVLGINLGKLGFLAEVAPSETEEAIKDLLENRYRVEERLVLKGSSDQLGDTSLHAVNDIVFSKGKSSRLIHLDVSIDGTFAVTYRGDGLILSTPTGSTAYALSNGGPIVVPTSNVFGLTPISPHTLSGRPLIVPDTSVIRINSVEEEQTVLVSTDGQGEAVMDSPMEFFVRKADYPLRLVKRLNRSYFDVLRAKFLWGRDPRSVT